MQFNKDTRDDKDINDIFKILWEKKLFISSVTLFTAIFSLLITLSLQNIYTSTALLAPTTPDESLSSKLGGLSTLGSIAGFSLPDEVATKSTEGIERIKSLEFFSKYFIPNIKLENLIAVKKWDAEENLLIYKKSLYDSSNKKWVRDFKFPQKLIPSEQEAFETYLDILNIQEDPDTLFVTLSIDHKSPIIAQKYVSIIVEQLNESMRQEDARLAEKSIDFLNETSKLTNIQSLKEAISELLENQMQILMLTASNDDYVFKTIDSPVVPEEESGPQRILISIMLTLFGFVLSVFLAIFTNKKS
mgnify:CR=1 FL=1